jgi:peptidoglycan glycosyltransferase
MNRSIRQLAVGLMACYIVLFAALNYWQVGQKEELDAKFDNTRQILREFNRPRGNIITADGVVAARSLPDTTNDNLDFVRDYPTGDLLANVTGYFTKDFGSTQVERQYGDVLVGSTAAQQVLALGDLLEGNVDNSGTVQLTLREDAQRAAKFALGGREGSVTVMDPNTGAIIAMYSNPTYDPNAFVGVPFEEAQQAITDLQNADGNPLLANAYQERYMPGSTFKVITTGIGLEAGVLSRETSFPNERQWVPPQTNDPIQNYNGSLCGGGMADVFRRSCNIPFAKTAIELGVDRFVSGTEAWGIGEQVPIDLPRAATSTIGNTENLDQTLPLLAIRGFGQSEDQMVPLHMAMVASAVANDGQMMVPYVVEATFDSAGRELSRATPEVWKTPISLETAALETEFMIGVVESGTASCCVDLDGGIQAAMKTGTAELGVASNPDLSHAWIIGFAPAENPQFSISVVLTNVQSTQDVSATGGRLAGPIAEGMFNYLLTGQGAR